MLSRTQSQWLFVLVGFMVVSALVLWTQYGNGFRFKLREDFADPPATTATPSTTNDVVAKQDIVELPQKSAMQLYLSSFSQPATYQCQSNYWCDAINANTKYFLLTSTLPATIDSAVGLPLQNVLVRGPAAYSLSTAQSNYIIGSFTIALYANITDIAFSETQARDVVMLDIPSQTPNKITCYLSPVPSQPSKVAVNMRFGSIVPSSSTDDTLYTWTFDKTTLMGENKLFAFVYEKGVADKAGSITFYHGGVKEEPKTVISDPAVTLGVSEITFNRNQNWTANLVAFAMYNTALSSSEVGALGTYFLQHSTGYAAQVIARETLETQVASLMNKVQTGEDTIKELLSKINATTCPTAAAAAQTTIPPKWLIKLGASADGVSTTELGKCSPLSIKSFGGSDEKKDIISEYPSNEKGSTTNKPKHVPYPPNSVTSKTEAQSIDGVKVANPASPKTNTPTNTSTLSATTTASSATTSPPSSDPQFWNQFFQFMNDQKSKNEAATTAATDKSDFNATYNTLRQEAQTDSSQPGSLLFQPAVQDPAKTADATNDNASSASTAAPPLSVWDKIVNVFVV